MRIIKRPDNSRRLYIYARHQALGLCYAWSYGTSYKQWRMNRERGRGGETRSHTYTNTHTHTRARTQAQHTQFSHV